MATKQLLLTLDEKEDKIVTDFAYEWRLSKANTIKLMVLGYRKRIKEV